MSSQNFSLILLIDKVSCAYKKRVHCTIYKQRKKLKHNYGVTKLSIICRRNSSTDYRVSSKEEFLLRAVCKFNE